MRKLLLLIALSGCVQDFAKLGTLEPMTEPGVYRWRTIADNFYPPDSPEWETKRLSQLAKVMASNPPCGRGYKVIDRQVTQKTEASFGGGTYDIFYTVRCSA